MTRSSRFGTLLLLALAFSIWGAWGHEFRKAPDAGKMTLDRETSRAVAKTSRGASSRPNDWFYVQRAYPYDTLSNEKNTAAIQFAKRARAEAQRKGLAAAAAVVWQQAGPTNIPGRITDLATVPSTPGTVYAASAAGGVFKSTDFGVTWTPSFNDEGNLSCGAIAIHPTNANVLYVGTGEANPAFDTYDGNGIYKSTDAGATWTWKGLPNSYRIGRIIVDPTRPETVYVAVGGKHFGGGNSQRGVYRSDNGGTTWTQKLFVSDSTACIDIALHPSTGTLFAAMWERIRYVDQPTRLGGATSGIYKSTDRGDTWTLLAGGLPASADTVGRIGLSLDPSSSTVYALYSNGSGVFMGLYKSTNLGVSWTRTNDQDLVDAPLNASWQGGWYFGQVRTAQGNPNTVYALGIDVWKSADGGNSWGFAGGGIHADQHALWINPANVNQVYDGSDGGVSYSTDGGSSWTQRVNQPSTQFYAIAIDPTNPERLYGGAQDNGSMRTMTGALNDWEQILGGDGFYCIVDPTDPDIIYAEFQNGYVYKSTDGGFSWFWALNGIDYGADRHGWNTPYVMDPSDHLTLYYGSNVLYKTTDGGNSWTAISGDLTNGPHPRGSFGTITTIAAAAADDQIVYVGTDDANVWVTQNGGGLWTLINSGLPPRWVTRVAADPYHANIAYVTVSGYLSGTVLPHIFRSENYGASWSDISGDLPDAPVNDVIPDPDDSLTLYIATDYGVYVTNNLGSTWAPLGTGLPIVAVHDIAFDDATRKLVAGTHGQSMFSTTVECPGTTDGDSDGIADLCDNCPAESNASQTDGDSDGVGDACDNCASAPNASQDNFDGDAFGDICDNCVRYATPGNVAVNAGDVNVSGVINSADIIALVNYVFKSGPAPLPITEAGEVNCDGNINSSDIIYLVNYVFKSGTAPCDICAL